MLLVACDKLALLHFLTAQLLSHCVTNTFVNPPSLHPRTKAQVHPTLQGIWYKSQT